MIERLKLAGMVRLKIEAQPDGQWEVRISKCASGQGDVVSRQKTPEAALEGASGLFLQFAPAAPRKAAPARPAASAKVAAQARLLGSAEDDDGSRLI